MTTKTKSGQYKDFLKRREAQRLVDVYSLLLEKFIVLNGTKGMGKTSSGIHLAYNLRELSQREVVVVGTLIGLTDEFGPNRFMSSADFICQMRLISQIAPTLSPDLTEHEISIALLNGRGCSNWMHDPDFVQLANGQWKRREIVSDKAMENIQDQGAPCWTSLNGVIIYRAIVLLDEGNEFTGGDSASNPLVRLFSKMIQEMRHLRITLILMTPGEEDLAPKIRRQVDTYGNCVTFLRANPVYTKVNFGDGVLMEKFSIRFPSERYWAMYTSYNLLALRERSLTIADKYI